MTKITIDAVADYVVTRLDEGGAPPNLLKLQKLLYYIQAWYLALKGEPLFDAKFQAWVHGPVSRRIYDRFSAKFMMYDAIRAKDVAADGHLVEFDPEIASHINEILEAYASFTGTQLENMTHDEEPWIQARGSLSRSARCEAEIDEKIMATYYKSDLDRVK